MKHLKRFNESTGRLSELEAEIKEVFNSYFDWKLKEMEMLCLAEDIQYIDKENVKLIGDEFDFYDNHYVLEEVIEMVRPDYELYHIPNSNIYSGAHMIQMLHGTKFLPIWQDPMNIETSRMQKSVIVDEQLWELSDEDLVKYFGLIKDYKYIMFKYPISLKRIVEK
jgi:hypothetical protein